MASGTKEKHLAKGQDFSPRAPGPWGPATTTPGGQGIRGSASGRLGKSPCLDRHLDEGGGRGRGVWTEAQAGYHVGGQRALLLLMLWWMGQPKASQLELVGLEL